MSWASSICSHSRSDSQAIITRHLDSQHHANNRAGQAVSSWFFDVKLGRMRGASSDIEFSMTSTVGFIPRFIPCLRMEFCELILAHKAGRLESWLTVPQLNLYWHLAMTALSKNERRIEWVLAVVPSCNQSTGFFFLLPTCWKSSKHHAIVLLKVDHFPHNCMSSVR